MIQHQQRINYPSNLESSLFAENQISLQAELSEILANVNWDFVSLPCILDVIRNEPLIR